MDDSRSGKLPNNSREETLRMRGMKRGELRGWGVDNYDDVVRKTVTVYTCLP